LLTLIFPKSLSILDTEGKKIIIIIIIIITVIIIIIIIIFFMIRTGVKLLYTSARFTTML